MNNFVKTITDENGITFKYGAITIDKVGPSALNAEKWEAQLRQEVTSVYPAQRNSNSLSDGLVDTQHFGEGDSYVEKRVAWVPVPKGFTAEQVQANLDNYPQATLHKTMSLQPVLSEEQINSMASGLNKLTMDDYKQKFVVDKEGNPALYHEMKQYRRIDFKKSFIADTDLRPAELEQVKGSVQLAATEKVGETAF